MTLALAIVGWWLAVTTWLGLVAGPRLGRSELKVQRAQCAWMLAVRLWPGAGLPPQLRAARDQWVDKGDLEALRLVITWAGAELEGGTDDQHDRRT